VAEPWVIGGRAVRTAAALLSTGGQHTRQCQSSVIYVEVFLARSHCRQALLLLILAVCINVIYVTGKLCYRKDDLAMRLIYE